MKNLPEFVKLSYAFAPVLEIILHGAGPVVPLRIVSTSGSVRSVNANYTGPNCVPPCWLRVRQVRTNGRRRNSPLRQVSSQLLAEYPGADGLALCWERAGLGRDSLLGLLSVMRAPISTQ